MYILGWKLNSLDKNNNELRSIWQTMAAPDVANVTRELTFGNRTSKVPSFGTRGFAPVFCKAKTDRWKKYETKVIEYWSISWKWFQLLFSCILIN